ncbi:histone-fold-containing protein [Basidiobolus meristosporus CBS 931.73]|uniref:DNA polymerase epsilon subunit D n=1 Tax=Basidiobolus meristosporus CBS 931.73 TaxID=1314790 RepID=A0A1Y1Y1W4_9FUNG|nr:histone-fold-containing protein [Basidiobolus meristosporus CBS 931.73]|eukprot:ORX91716.1 histone-fold-containing protein [Basidiobolus meristosporus CBS 931.73]
MLPLDKLELPRSVLVEISKEGLPSGSIINKEAKSAISRAAVVFISYLTAVANEHAGTKKTISTNNVLQALSTVEFSEFIPTLELELMEYRRMMKEKKESKAKSNGSTSAVEEEAGDDLEETCIDDPTSPVASVRKRKVSIGSEEEEEPNKNRRTNGSTQSLESPSSA